MKSLAYKFYIQYILPFTKHPIKYLSTSFAILGSYYTLSEFEQSMFNTQNLIGYLRDYTIQFIFVIAIITLFVLKEKSEHCAYLGSRDTIISLNLANLLNIKNSAIVIPTNTTFDTIMNRTPKIGQPLIEIPQ